MSAKMAVILFPGMNCEIESIRALKRNGIEAEVVRWNKPLSLTLSRREREQQVHGYFLPGGFSYEDRGRSGMIAGRDPLMEFLKEEAECGKVVIGHCNGAQILVESGMIPLGEHLDMALAQNSGSGSGSYIPFINKWVWMKVACSPDRCAVSGWDGTMQVPIAHGEGRFTTRDPELIKELKQNDQIAFQYCDEEGTVSDDTNPNGSIDSIAGICNPAGNVIALMPHPERTTNGDAYFESLKKWIISEERRAKSEELPASRSPLAALTLPPKHESDKIEIFIDTIITNNEERSLEQILKKYLPNIELKQLRYIKGDPDEILHSISHFNPNKEVAYVRRFFLSCGERIQERGSKIFHWDPETRSEEVINSNILEGVKLLRIDDGAKEGVCYVCKNVDGDALNDPKILEIFANPHASTITRT